MLHIQMCLACSPRGLAPLGLKRSHSHGAGALVAVQMASEHPCLPLKGHSPSLLPTNRQEQVGLLCWGVWTGPREEEDNLTFFPLPGFSFGSLGEGHPHAGCGI